MNVVRVCRGNILIIKKCPRCGEFKFIENFHKYKRASDGYKHYCKKCAKNYYDKNSDVKKSKQSLYRINHKKEIQEYFRVYNSSPERRKLICERHKNRRNKKIKEFIDSIIPNSQGSNVVGIIYLVHNKVTNKYYVGQTKVGFDLRYREGFFNRHIYNNRNPNLKIKKYLDLYGEDSFEFNKEFKICYNEEDLYKLEAYYINYFDSFRNGYNRNRGMYIIH